MYVCVKMTNDLSDVPEGALFIPEFPNFPDLEIHFADDKGAFPFFKKSALSQEAVFYGVCNSVDESSPYLISVISETEYQSALRNIHYRAPHREGWVFDEEHLAWVPPLPRPDDGKNYEWDDANGKWVEV